MNRNFINETDLHIQYKLETGKYYEDRENVDQESYDFYREQNNSKDYQLWLEDNLIKQINKQFNK